MNPRKAVRPHYDAVVGLFPQRAIPKLAYALAKFTCQIRDGQCRVTAAEPLFHDIRDPETKPRLLPGSEFWPFKYQADVVVRGSALAPGGNPVRSMQVSVSVGRATKRIQVFGRRVVTWDAQGKPRFEGPAPFKKVSIEYANAYGGADQRVPVGPGPLTVGDVERLQVDHPGLYPRNPFGMGYLVRPDPIEGVELPCLEDPDDLLTPARLIVGNPALWHRQPLPMAFEYTNPLMFPRFCFLGLDAWFTPPQDQTLAEIRRGWLPANYRAEYGTEVDPMQNAPPPYFQEASLGMVFPDLAEGTPIAVRGMHPEQPEIRFSLPPAPRMAIEIDRQRQVLKAQLCNVLIEPAQSKVSLVYVVRTEKLPRVLVPGIHSQIPLSVTVEDDAPVAYESPATVRERLKAAQANPS
jgi:hypothetical protein